MVRLQFLKEISTIQQKYFCWNNKSKSRSREILDFTQVTARFIWSSVPLSFRRESEREEADYNAEKLNKKGAWGDLNY